MQLGILGSYLAAFILDNLHWGPTFQLLLKDKCHITQQSEKKMSLDRRTRLSQGKKELMRIWGEIASSACKVLRNTTWGQDENAGWKWIIKSLNPISWNLDIFTPKVKEKTLNIFERRTKIIRFRKWAWMTWLKMYKTRINL